MSIGITQLKIKLKSLAAEARIIRKEELKNKGTWSWKAESFHSHRVNQLRPITRATHVAYGLLRGLGYHQIEPTSKSEPDWDKVRKMVVKYSDLSNEKSNLAILNEWVANINVLALAA